MADDLRGTYRLYKDDTTAYLTWLAITAESHGHQIHVPSAAPKPRTMPTPRLKGKARKLAQNAAKAPKQTVQPGKQHQLSLEEFTPCAETLANARPRVVIPKDILAIG